MSVLEVMEPESGLKTQQIPTTCPCTSHRWQSVGSHSALRITTWGGFHISELENHSCGGVCASKETIWVRPLGMHRSGEGSSRIPRETNTVTENELDKLWTAVQSVFGDIQGLQDDLATRLFDAETSLKDFLGAENANIAHLWEQGQHKTRLWESLHNQIWVLSQDDTPCQSDFAKL